MQAIPLQAIPSQEVSVSLNGQLCTLDIYQKYTGVYMDIYVDNELILGGAQCLNMNRVVISGYLGLVGDLAFFDTQGIEDPNYTQFGTRFILLYLFPDDIAPPYVGE